MPHRRRSKKTDPIPCPNAKYGCTEVRFYPKQMENHISRCTYGPDSGGSLNADPEPIEKTADQKSNVPAYISPEPKTYTEKPGQYDSLRNVADSPDPPKPETTYSLNIWLMGIDWVSDIFNDITHSKKYTIKGGSREQLEKALNDLGPFLLKNPVWVVAIVLTFTWGKAAWSDRELWKEKWENRKSKQEKDNIEDPNISREE